jgi:hypothetical protein
MNPHYPIRLRCLALLLPACLCWQSASGGLVPSREDIIFLVDNSRNMQRVDGQLALPASIGTFVSRINSDVRAALILFDDTVTLEVPFTPVGDGQLGNMLTGLERINYESRFSNAAAALERALYEQQHSGRKGAGKTILLFSSGVIDTGNEAHDLNFTRWMSSVLGEDAAESHIRVFCIAFSKNGDISLFETLARETGGSCYRYSGGDNLPALLEHAAVEIFSKPLPSVR